MDRLLIFTILNFLGAMSPGPDFAIVTKFGLTGSRKAALYATFGITCALFVHVAYSLLGITLILKETPALYSAVQIVGACYLLYIAVPMLFLGKEGGEKLGAVDVKRAFMTGFWTNLLNPKATVLILSLFVQFLEPGDSLGLKMMFGLAVPLCALAWFSLYSCMLTHKAVVPIIQKGQRPLTFCMGALLGLVGLVIILKNIMELFYDINS